MTQRAKVVEEGWAVRIRLHMGGRAWINHGGGYSQMRRDRRVWGDYDEALDASHEWDARDPVIVRVKFWASAPTALAGTPQEGATEK